MSYYPLIFFDFHCKNRLSINFTKLVSHIWNKVYHKIKKWCATKLYIIKDILNIRGLESIHILNIYTKALKYIIKMKNHLVFLIIIIQSDFSVYFYLNRYIYLRLIVWDLT